ncbi:MAG: recombinase family protein [Acidobacteriota bacterium]
MANGKFVSYIRVSTQRQGKSGLGLEAQRGSVTSHLNGGRWDLIAELVEVESGKRADRPKLAEALALCRRHKATLVIAKLDRLARNVAFIANLMESGVEFVACDMPQANRFTLHILAAVAEHEAAMISARTKAALAAAKARGVRLGATDPNRIAKYARKGTQARQKASAARARELQPVIASLKAEGAITLHDLATGLNAKHISAPRGGEWSATQVMRLLAAQ